MKKSSLKNLLGNFIFKSISVLVGVWIGVLLGVLGVVLVGLKNVLAYCLFSTKPITRIVFLGLVFQLELIVYFKWAEVSQAYGQCYQQTAAWFGCVFAVEPYILFSLLLWVVAAVVAGIYAFIQSKKRFVYKYNFEAKEVLRLFHYLEGYPYQKSNAEKVRHYVAPNGTDPKISIFRSFKQIQNVKALFFYQKKLKSAMRAFCDLFEVNYSEDEFYKKRWLSNNAPAELEFKKKEKKIRGNTRFIKKCLEKIKSIKI